MAQPGWSVPASDLPATGLTPSATWVLRRRRSRGYRTPQRPPDGGPAGPDRSGREAVAAAPATIGRVQPPRSLPVAIGGLAVPQDDVSTATWRYVQRWLPSYLLAHSVRSYCWGASIGAGERRTFDRQVLWTASLLHDLGLTRIPRNGDCFEVAGGAFARRFLEGAGLPASRAAVVDRAIVLHMQPGVTIDDGVEAVLLDRATALDVRGVGFELVADVRPAVMREFPRGAFDRHFLAAISREAALRPDCQSARLLHATGLAGWMERSPWAPRASGRRASGLR